MLNPFNLIYLKGEFKNFEHLFFTFYTSFYPDWYIQESPSFSSNVKPNSDLDYQYMNGLSNLGVFLSAKKFIVVYFSGLLVDYDLFQLFLYLYFFLLMSFYRRSWIKVIDFPAKLLFGSCSPIPNCWECFSYLGFLMSLQSLELNRVTTH